MLCLGRRTNQAVIVRDDKGNEMRIVVLEKQRTGQSVRIGIDAPRSWAIVREELLPAFASERAATGENDE